jgi:feruloyl esterase
MLEANSLAECDELDGRKDGIISKPLICKINLDILPECGKVPDSNCLTKTEKTVIQKWYDGPQNSKGEQVFPGMAPGSERFWDYWYLGDGTRPGPGTLLADGYGTYLGYPEDPAGYNSLDFNFDTDVEKLKEQGKLYNALEPDLTAFKQAGGKMIMWHGLSDPLVLPNQSPAYYEAVEAKMGGRDTVQSFYRLFMAPGLGHCWDKPANAPDQMSMLAALEDWVEKDQAPDVIELTQYYPESDRVKRRGKLMPYPLAAEYGPLIP